MFVPISNVPRDYAWGSTTGISDALGTIPSGGPEAELWLGAHSGSPSEILQPASVGGARTLAEWIAADPATTLAGDDLSVDPTTGAPRLPFLLKILAAGGPLSLQAHPTSATARERFVAENAAGVPLDAADRNYKDPFHKPEVIFALSEEFHALCGFRDLRRSRELLATLRALAADQGAETSGIDRFARLLEGDAESALRASVEWLLGGSDRAGVAELLEAVVPVSASAAARDSAFALEFATVGSLAESYPGDPGVVLSLLLNRVVLSRGEVLYLPAGNIHAYLLGTGVELMAASDNVLRGGLTPKHIDVPELVDVLEFSPLPVPYLAGESLGDGVVVFRPDVPDFRLVVVTRTPDTTGESVVAIDGPVIAIATDGPLTVTGAHSTATIARGESTYITPDERELRIEGSGELFLATTA